MKSTNKKTESTKVAYSVKVIRAKEVKDGTAVFDMEVNGITIYGCWYREYTNKEGKDGVMISLPQYKGTDGNYYNHCFFPISKELREEICTQVEQLV